MAIINFVLYLVFPLVVIHKVSLNRTAFNEDVLSKNDSLVLRGIVACGIMFSHYVAYLEDMGYAVGLAKLYEPVGGIGVCIFFFLSGYGLSASTQGKPAQLSFLWKRIEKIYLPFVAMRLIFSFFVLERPSPFLYRIGYVFGIFESFWFVNIILLLYFAFFFCWKFTRNPLLTMFFVTAFICVLLSCLGFVARWYNANLVFVFGMLWYSKRNACIAWCKNRYLFKLAGSGAAFIVMSLLFEVNKNTQWGDYI